MNQETSLSPSVSDEAGNFDTAYVVIEVRKATAELVIPSWVIVMATVVIGGVVAGTALVLLKRRRKKLETINVPRAERKPKRLAQKQDRL